MATIINIPHSVLCILLLSVSLLVHGANNIPVFAQQQDEARYKQLTLELRCPKCQNQDLADSNAPIAADLRNQIVNMITQGKTDQEIIDYMVARYGDFVLYKPRFAGYNLVLWLAPIGLLLVGAAIVIWIVKTNHNNTTKDVVDHAEKQQQLRALLAQKDET